MIGQVFEMALCPRRVRIVGNPFTGEERGTDPVSSADGGLVADASHGVARFVR